jgi:hypothetical protein
MGRIESLKRRIPRGGIFDVARRLKDKRQWASRDYSMPAPPQVKHQVLARYDQGGTWVETGTFLGDTTAFLAKGNRRVVSIEPSALLVERAQKRFANSSQVRIIKGTSEEVFEDLISDLSGPVSFWLDGHFSQGLTFQSSLDTPIVEELTAIGKHLNHLYPISVLVDDVRCFDPLVDAGYPHRRVLIEWAEKAQLNWCIEHDIFVAWSTDSKPGT